MKLIDNRWLHASFQARISRLEAALSGNSRTAAVGIGMAAPSHHPVAGGASTSRDEAIIPLFAAQGQSSVV